MPFKPPDQARCPKCGKSVYAAEERIAAGKKWHKFCFKCGLCNKLLDSTNSTEHEGELYCKVCHGRKYGPKGYGFGSGAGTLSMDTGEQFGNTEAEMSNRPTEVVIGAGSASGTGVKCPRCGKTVYEAERAIGLTDVDESGTKQKTTELAFANSSNFMCKNQDLNVDSQWYRSIALLLHYPCPEAIYDNLGWRWSFGCKQKQVVSWEKAVNKRPKTQTHIIFIRRIGKRNKEP